MAVKTTKPAVKKTIVQEAPEDSKPDSSVKQATNVTPYAKYADDPAGFARDVLGSHWWRAQEQIAELLAHNRRVAVKAANGVGKTYLAADLTLWFLYSHANSVVLTTAPTWRQVESLLWEELRKRVRQVNGAALQQNSDALFDAKTDTKVEARLPGRLLQTGLKIAEGYFAMGLSTDEPVRFQGFHAEDLLVVLDEACGIPEEIWDAVEGICVGKNNRVLAISNPLTPSGRFYSLFSASRWKTCTISALMHPNVVRHSASVPQIPGAVTREAVEDRIASWCEEIEQDRTTEKIAGRTAAKKTGETESADADTFQWHGKTYRPNGLFRARVLGEFPEAGDDSLCSLSWIETAMLRGESDSKTKAASTYVKDENSTVNDGAGKYEMGKDETGAAELCVIAVDVARFGSDETVWAVRRGKSVLRIMAAHGLDTMAVAGRTHALAIEVGAQIVAIDEVGVGAGVVDRLREAGLAGILGVQFGARPVGLRESELYLNLRAQTYWELRERLRMKTITLPRDETLKAQLMGLRYDYTGHGQIQIESKADMRRRGLPSPDRADAVAMLFCPGIHSGECHSGRIHKMADNEGSAPEPIHWADVTFW